MTIILKTLDMISDFICLINKWQRNKSLLANVLTTREYFWGNCNGTFNPSGKKVRVRLSITTREYSNNSTTRPALIIIEVGNYYSKSTFIMTLIKQEKLVFVLVISGSSYVFFTKLFTGTRRFPILGIRFQFWVGLSGSNFGYPVPEITENAQP